MHSAPYIPPSCACSIGRNIKFLIDRPDEEHFFRLHEERVYYLSNTQMHLSTNVGREQLLSVGTCFGKFTHSKKFRLAITCLDYLAQFAQYKVWVKPSVEMSFLYGNHILKSGLGRMTEDCPKYQGVIVYSMSDVPLGFGTTAKSTIECRNLAPTATVVFHQADVGEYLRDEDTLT